MPQRAAARAVAGSPADPTGPILLQKARVLSGDRGEWQVAGEHHGIEIWVVAEPPRDRRFRDRTGRVATARVYRRPDGLVARAEYVELLPHFRAAAR